MNNWTAWGVCVVFLIVAGILDLAESGLAIGALIAAPAWIIVWYIAKKQTYCHGEVHYNL